MNKPMSMGHGRVTVLGGINVDLVVHVDRLPRPGQTVAGGAVERHFGGKGANQAVAAARAGASVTMLGAVGRDADGDASLAALAAEGIDVSRVTRVDAPTGVALIVVDATGENQIAVAPGANAALAADADLAVQGGGLLLVSFEAPMPAVMATVGDACGRGLMVVINPAPAALLPAALLAYHQVLVLNEHELPIGFGVDGYEAGVTALQERGQTAAVTRGAAGAVLMEGGMLTEIPAWRGAAAVDTTGAGDCFAGVLAAWLAGGAALDEAARAATVAAGLSIAKPGARTGMPTADQISAALSSAEPPPG